MYMVKLLKSLSLENISVPILAKEVWTTMSVVLELILQVNSWTFGSLKWQALELEPRGTTRRHGTVSISGHSISFNKCFDDAVDTRRMCWLQKAVCGECLIPVLLHWPPDSSLQVFVKSQEFVVVQCYKTNSTSNQKRALYNICWHSL